MLGLLWHFYLYLYTELSDQSTLLEIIVPFTAVSLRIIANPMANVLQKTLTEKGQKPLVVNFTSYLLLSLPCTVVVFFTDLQTLTWPFWGYSVLSGMVGALGNGFLVRSLEKGDLSVLGPINAYKSVVGMVMGSFLLREIPSLWGLLGTALIVYGSFFVLDTTTERFSWALLKKKEIQYRLWAMVLTAIEAVLIKKVIHLSSVPLSFLSWCLFGAFFSLLFLPLSKWNPIAEIKLLTTNDLSKYLGLVLCIGTMQWATLYAFDYLQVGYALSFFQLSTLLSVLFGYHYFKEKDILKKILGAAIMMVGSIVIILWN